MTKLLTIDTTSGTSVAIHIDGHLAAAVHHDSGVKHAELIGNAIIDVLEQARLKPAELTCVAVGRGPGLFTGLRVGIAAAIWFAEGIDKPLFGVISLDAIALQLLTEEPTHAPLLVHTDARRGEVYYAIYQGLDRKRMPVRLSDPSVGKFDDVLESAAELHNGFVAKTGGATAEWVGKLADLQLSSQVASEDASALYLRAPDAAEPKPNQMFGKRVSS
ncbi:MAG: hypothetical protein RL556_93 [Actinomycetota bacterium]